MLIGEMEEEKIVKERKRAELNNKVNEMIAVNVSGKAKMS
jgi:hypothetical protein